MKNLTLMTALVLSLLTVSCREDDTFYTNVLRSDVFYQLYEDSSFDFLWMLDNSPTMKSRRDFIRDNMQNFVNILTSRKAVDYQMAVVDVDLFAHGGNLIKTAGGLEVVKSRESANPVADFAQLVNAVTDSPTSFWEQGLESVYQAIHNHRARFSRPGVPLVVVVLSDEDDYSCSGMKDGSTFCYGVQPEDNPDDIPYEVSRYIDFFGSVKAVEKTDLHFFPIVGLEGGACPVPSTGGRYLEVMAGLAGKGSLGVEGDICTVKLAESFNRVAQIIADRGHVFRLGKEASGADFRVFVDGVLVPFSPENYVYDENRNAIVFTGAVPKKGSVIEIAYAEKRN